MYTTVSEITYSNLTKVVEDLSKRQSFDTESAFLKGLLPSLIMLRGLIVPPSEYADFASSTADPVVGGVGGSEVGAVNVPESGAPTLGSSASEEGIS